MRVWPLLVLLVASAAPAAYALPTVHVRWERVAAEDAVAHMLFVENRGAVDVAYGSCDVEVRYLDPAGTEFDPSPYGMGCDVVFDATLEAGKTIQMGAGRFDGQLWRGGERMDAPAGTYAVEASFRWSFGGLPHTTTARAPFTWP